jgi:hypothetical protein
VDWLARLKHDLVKRAVWLARDLRDAGGAIRPADRAALRRNLIELPDEEGRPVAATALWRVFREESTAPAAALDAFGAAVEQAEAAALDADDHPAEAIDAALALEPAFEALAREVRKR